jgi:hypothetical protein
MAEARACVDRLLVSNLVSVMLPAQMTKPTHGFQALAKTMPAAALGWRPDNGSWAAFLRCAAGAEGDDQAHDARGVVLARCGTHAGRERGTGNEMQE